MDEGKAERAGVDEGKAERASPLEERRKKGAEVDCTCKRVRVPTIEVLEKQTHLAIRPSGQTLLKMDKFPG